MNQPTGLFLVNSNGKIFGNADESEWNTQPKYKKIIGFFFRRYKAKYIKIKPFQERIADLEKKDQP